MLIRTIALLFLFFSNLAYADQFPCETQYKTCFSPNPSCEQLLINQIQSAKSSIFIQAYSFTSKPIADALLTATKRKVKVKVILDKSQFSNNSHSVTKVLLANHIPLWKDGKRGLAHNKVMIFDKHITEIGSYNFTKAAKTINAENILIIDNKSLAATYLKNWHNRQKRSLRVYKLYEHQRQHR